MYKFVISTSCAMQIRYAQCNGDDEPASILMQWCLVGHGRTGRAFALLRVQFHNQNHAVWCRNPAFMCCPNILRWRRRLCANSNGTVSCRSWTNRTYVCIGVWLKLKVLLDAVWGVNLKLISCANARCSSHPHVLSKIHYNGNDDNMIFVECMARRCRGCWLYLHNQHVR